MLIVANSYMTVYGAEKHLNYFNDSLFADVNFPTGIDRDTAINNIIMACGEFPILYTNLDFFKECVTVWGNKYGLAFAKWVEGFASEFSPIDNYDRNEYWEDHSGSEDKTTFGRKTTETHEVSAANSSNYQPKDKNTTDLSNSDTTTTKANSKHEGRIHGNIGVMRTTDILEGWMNFYKDYNIYDIMADTFVREFCILVY